MSDCIDNSNGFCNRVGCYVTNRVCTRLCKHFEEKEQDHSAWAYFCDKCNEVHDIGERCLEEYTTKCDKQRYRLSGIPEDIKNLEYETDGSGAHYIELTEEEKQDLIDKGYYLEDYKITP